MNKIQKTAYVFMIISSVVLGFYILPLAWCIPMCVYYNNNYKKISVSFIVCTMLFINPLCGILMLLNEVKQK